MTVGAPRVHFEDEECDERGHIIESEQGPREYGDAEVEEVIQSDSSPEAFDCGEDANQANDEPQEEEVTDPSRTDDQYLMGHRRPELTDNDVSSSDKDADLAPWVPELQSALDATGENGQGEEELTYFSSTYEMLHRFHLEESCLSCDFVPDHLGANRSEFPHAAFVVAGTQAERDEDNRLYVFSLNDIARTRDDEQEAVDDDQPDDLEVRISIRAIYLEAPATRVRVAPWADSLGLVGVWQDDGRVLLFDVSDELYALGNTAVGDTTMRRQVRGRQPVHGSVTGLQIHRQPLAILPHKAPGWALAFSPRERLMATGDEKGSLRLWRVGSLVNGKVDVQKVAEVHHEYRLNGRDQGIEAICFAPAASGWSYLATASDGGEVIVWDANALIQGAKSDYCMHLHIGDEDINSIAWEPIAPYRLVVGDQKGTVTVITLQDGIRATASFSFSDKSITSIAFSPFADGVFATSHEEGGVVLWDIDAIEDDDDMADLPDSVKRMAERLPANVIFAHRGQYDTMDVRWHPQIRHALISVAQDDINLWSPFKEVLEPVEDGDGAAAEE